MQIFFRTFSCKENRLLHFDEKMPVPDSKPKEQESMPVVETDKPKQMGAKRYEERGQERMRIEQKEREAGEKKMDEQLKFKEHVEKLEDGRLKIVVSPGLSLEEIRKGGKKVGFKTKEGLTIEKGEGEFIATLHIGDEIINVTKDEENVLYLTKTPDGIYMRTFGEIEKNKEGDAAFVKGGEFVAASDGETLIIEVPKGVNASYKRNPELQNALDAAPVAVAQYVTFYMREGNILAIAPSNAKYKKAIEGTRGGGDIKATSNLEGGFDFSLEKDTFTSGKWEKLTIKGMKFNETSIKALDTLGYSDQEESLNFFHWKGEKGSGYIVVPNDLGKRKIVYISEPDFKVQAVDKNIRLPAR